MNQTEWFSSHRPNAEFFLGDRVCGHFQGMPYVGTVMIDHMVNTEQGSVTKVALDLPLKVDGTYYQLLIIPNGEGIRRLPSFAEETPKKVVKKTKKSPKTDASCINKTIHTGTLY